MAVRWVGAALALGLAAIGLALLAAPGQAQGRQSHAGLVVQYEDGSVASYCVAFDEPEISGVELLERAGVEFTTQSSGIGAAVCSIGGQGCAYPSEDCFCRCKSADCAYWALQRLEGQRWAYSSLGASAARVRDGDVQGWAWGAGSVKRGSEPPVLPFAQVCAAALAPPASPEPSPSAAQPSTRPQPSPSAAPAPTAPAAAPPAPAAASGAPPQAGGLALFVALAAALVAGIGLALARRRRV